MTDGEMLKRAFSADLAVSQSPSMSVAYGRGAACRDRSG